MDRTASSTTSLIGVLVIVFLLQVLAAVLGSPLELALSWPLTDRPWTLLTSVLAHDGLFHLVSNVLGLFVLGTLLERQTEPWRFYVFFFVVGAIAGATEVTVTQFLGDGVSVLGASGGIFGLLGYLLAGNRLTDAVASRLRVRPLIAGVLILAIAFLITWLSRGRHVALIAHFTGLVLGLLAGRAHILRSGKSATEARSTAHRRF